MVHLELYRKKFFEEKIPEHLLPSGRYLLISFTFRVTGVLKKVTENVKFFYVQDLYFADNSLSLRDRLSPPLPKMSASTSWTSRLNIVKL